MQNWPSCASLVAALALICGVSIDAAFPAKYSLQMPQPFTRVLHLLEPPMNGSDVIIVQHLLTRANGCESPPLTGLYDAATVHAVKCFQLQTPALDEGANGVFGVATAGRALRLLGHDNFRDNGTSAAALGYKYKIAIPVHTNRSIETQATLFDAHNNVLLQFPVRAHGHDVDSNGQRIDGMPWPDLSDDGCPQASARQGCIGLNSFSHDGATPTGLTELDLNTPEDEPKYFGPFPVNRFVRGLEGNAGFLIPNQRDGILLHTGEWANFSSWQPGQPMPNSAGCVHSTLPSIERVWKLLVEKCGVEARPNTNGKTPYPYKPQGIVAVYNIDT